MHKTFRKIVCILSVLCPLAAALPAYAATTLTSTLVSSDPLEKAAYHTITKMPDGFFVKIGGYSSGSAKASISVFNPMKKIWTDSSYSLSSARFYHTATLTTNGTAPVILVAGGFSGSDYTPVSALEVVHYNVDTHSVSSVTTVSGKTFPFGGHSANVITDGSGTITFDDGTKSVVGKVLLCGGRNKTAYSSSCYIASVGDGDIKATGSMHVTRAFHAAVGLDNGGVFISGGRNTDGYLRVVEQFSPNSLQWSVLEPLEEGRAYHSMFNTNGDIIVIAGGYNDNSYGPLPHFPSVDGTYEYTLNSQLMDKETHPGFMHAIGSMGYLNTVEVYNLNTQVKSDNNYKLPYRVAYQAGFVRGNGDMVMVGGRGNIFPQHTSIPTVVLSKGGTLDFSEEGGLYSSSAVDVTLKGVGTLSSASGAHNTGDGAVAGKILDGDLYMIFPEASSSVTDECTLSGYKLATGVSYSINVNLCSAFGEDSEGNALRAFAFDMGDTDIGADGTLGKFADSLALNAPHSLYQLAQSGVPTKSETTSSTYTVTVSSYTTSKSLGGGSYSCSQDSDGVGTCEGTAKFYTPYITLEDISAVYPSLLKTTATITFSDFSGSWTSPEYTYTPTSGGSSMVATASGLTILDGTENSCAYDSYLSTDSTHSTIRVRYLCGAHFTSSFLPGGDYTGDTNAEAALSSLYTSYLGAAAGQSLLPHGQTTLSITTTKGIKQITLKYDATTAGSASDSVLTVRDMAFANSIEISDTDYSNSIPSYLTLNDGKGYVPVWGVDPVVQSVSSYYISGGFTAPDLSAAVEQGDKNLISSDSDFDVNVCIAAGGGEKCYYKHYMDFQSSVTASAVSDVHVLPISSSLISDNLTQIGSLSSGRYGHTSTIIDQNNILTCGGAHDLTMKTTLATCERTTITNDVASATLGFTVTTTDDAVMTSSRTAHTATLLPNGRILFVGGLNGSGIITGSSETELYNINSKSFVSDNVVGKMTNPRAYHTAVLLPDGNVFISGGSTVDEETGAADISDTYDLYITTANMWDSDFEKNRVSGTGNRSKRTKHVAVLLDNKGTVALFGGTDGVNSLKSIEVVKYSGGSAIVYSGGEMITGRSNFTVNRLSENEYVVAGGIGDSGILNSMELCTFDGDHSFSCANAGSLYKILDDGTTEPYQVYNHSTYVDPSSTELVLVGGANRSNKANMLWGFANLQSNWSAAVTFPTDSLSLSQSTLVPANNGFVLVIGGADESEAKSDIYAFPYSEIADSTQKPVITNTASVDYIEDQGKLTLLSSDSENKFMGTDSYGGNAGSGHADFRMPRVFLQAMNNANTFNIDISSQIYNSSVNANYSDISSSMTFVISTATVPLGFYNAYVESNGRMSNAKSIKVTEHQLSGHVCKVVAVSTGTMYNEGINVSTGSINFEFGYCDSDGNDAPAEKAKADGIYVYIATSSANSLTPDMLIATAPVASESVQVNSSVSNSLIRVAGVAYNLSGESEIYSQGDDGSKYSSYSNYYYLKAAAPSNLRVTKAEYGNIVLQWDTNGNADYTRYDVAYTTATTSVSGSAVPAAGSWTDVSYSVTGSSYTFSDLDNDISYYFRVRAKNGDSSGDSNKCTSNWTRDGDGNDVLGVTPDTTTWNYGASCYGDSGVQTYCSSGTYATAHTIMIVDNVDGVAKSSSSIQWDWNSYATYNDKVYFEIYQASVTDVGVSTYAIVTSTTTGSYEPSNKLSYLMTTQGGSTRASLQPDTKYIIGIRAFEKDGSTYKWGKYKTYTDKGVYTLALLPSITSFEPTTENLTSNQIVLKYNTSDINSCAIYISSDSAFTNEKQVDCVPNVSVGSYTFTANDGIEYNNTYYINICSINGDSKENCTLDHNYVSSYTVVPSAPEDFEAEAKTSSSIDLSWTNSDTNTNNTLYYLIYATGPVSSDAAQNCTYKNDDGVYVNCKGLTYTDNGENNIQSAISTTTASFDGMKLGKCYCFSLYAYNSAYPDSTKYRSSKVFTAAQTDDGLINDGEEAGVDIPAGSSGTLNATFYAYDTYSVTSSTAPLLTKVEAVFPTGIFPQDTTVSISRPDSDKGEYANGLSLCSSDLVDSSDTNSYLSLLTIKLLRSPDTGSLGNNFSLKVTADINNMPADGDYTNVYLARYAGNNDCLKLETNVAKITDASDLGDGEKRYTISVDKLGTFKGVSTSNLSSYGVSTSTAPMILQLIYKQTSQDYSSLRIYPNPVKPNSSSEQSSSLYIDGLPNNSKITIFTLSGVKVYEANVTGSVFTWNLKNKSGNAVASGVYLALIKSSAGKKIVKIAVER